MSVKIESIDPEFGVNYNKGYVGFTYYNTSVISRGIAYITRWAKMGDIKVSHTLLVTGKDECIEAHIKQGVVRSTLTKYFDDPRCQIFFRKPVGLTSDIAKRIEAVAAAQVGTKYDTDLIVAEAAQGGIIGKLVNRIFHGKPDRLVSKLLNRDDRWICSELVAYCLDEQPEYHNQGSLHDPNETIDPQELFEDAVIFEPWKHKG